VQPQAPKLRNSLKCCTGWIWMHFNVHIFFLSLQDCTELKFENSNELEPSGFVLANDTEESRCYMLSHQLRRLRSPNVAVTNHDAQNFPTLLLAPREGSTEQTKMLFDRILCDVPCSGLMKFDDNSFWQFCFPLVLHNLRVILGDGTLRKAPDLWRRWDADMGKNLHRIQVSTCFEFIYFIFFSSL
jgi:hypothetical protein